MCGVRKKAAPLELPDSAKCKIFNTIDYEARGQSNSNHLTLALFERVSLSLNGNEEKYGQLNRCWLDS